MRAELIGAVRTLTDLANQEQVRVWRNYPHAGFFDDLDKNIHILFDDTQVLPDPETAVGAVLHSREVEALRGLGMALDPLMEELGDCRAGTYLMASASRLYGRTAVPLRVSLDPDAYSGALDSRRRRTETVRHNARPAPLLQE